MRAKEYIESLQSLPLQPEEFEPNDWYDLMESYAQSLLNEKLKEQRDLCAKEWNLKHGYKFSDLYDETVMSEIKNAPEPKI